MNELMFRGQLESCWRLPDTTVIASQRAHRRVNPFLLPRCKLMFSAQCYGGVVGAIIDRPARKCRVFALVLSEFVTLYCAGAH